MYWCKTVTWPDGTDIAFGESLPGLDLLNDKQGSTEDAARLLVGGQAVGDLPTRPRPYGPRPPWI